MNAGLQDVVSQDPFMHPGPILSFYILSSFHATCLRLR